MCNWMVARGMGMGDVLRRMKRRKVLQKEFTNAGSRTFRWDRIDFGQGFWRAMMRKKGGGIIWTSCNL